ERAVDDDARRLQLRLERDAARLRLAAAQREHAVHHLLELQHFVRLANAPRRESRQLLADHAELARLLDLVAQRAQAGTIDLSRRREDVDALKRRSERRRDLRADLRNEVVPALTLGCCGCHGVGSRGCGAGGFGHVRRSLVVWEFGDAPCRAGSAVWAT